MRKFLMMLLGGAYIWLDRGIEYDINEILGIKIDNDFQTLSRREVCHHIEKTFGLEHDAFWNLASTQKIRLGCQLARNLRDKK
jgi:hypothetical protein